MRTSWFKEHWKSWNTWTKCFFLIPICAFMAWCPLLQRCHHIVPDWQLMLWGWQATYASVECFRSGLTFFLSTNAVKWHSRFGHQAWKSKSTRTHQILRRIQQNPRKKRRRKEKYLDPLLPSPVMSGQVPWLISIFQREIHDERNARSEIRGSGTTIFFLNHDFSVWNLWFVHDISGRKSWWVHVF